MSRLPFTPDEYRELVCRMTPPSRMLRGYWRAFWVGGAICCLGQALTLWAQRLNLGEVTAPMFTTGCLIFSNFELNCTNGTSTAIIVQILNGSLYALMPS